jgi:hypothetical protein
MFPQASVAVKVLVITLLQLVVPFEAVTERVACKLTSQLSVTVQEDM